MKNIILLSADVVASCFRLSAQKNDKANLVLFMGDDYSYYDLGIYRSKDSQAPNTDVFASEVIRFTKAYRAASMCLLTRHNLLTGIWLVKSGAYPNHTVAREGNGN